MRPGAASIPPLPPRGAALPPCHPLLHILLTEVLRVGYGSIKGWGVWLLCPVVQQDHLVHVSAAVEQDGLGYGRQALPSPRWRRCGRRSALRARALPPGTRLRAGYRRAGRHGPGIRGILCALRPSTGVCGRIGARIVFRLSTVRRMTYTLVAATALSSLLWNHGALRSGRSAARRDRTCSGSRAPPPSRHGSC